MLLQMQTAKGVLYRMKAMARTRRSWPKKDPMVSAREEEEEEIAEQRSLTSQLVEGRKSF